MVGGISITDIGSHATSRVELYMDYPYQTHICMYAKLYNYCVVTLENQSYI